jgi:hypothetical protein
MVGFVFAAVNPHRSSLLHVVKRACGCRPYLGKEITVQSSNLPKKHTGKYWPLWQWLTKQPADTLEVSFDDIESIIGFHLPDSCYSHVQHWHGYKGSAVSRAIVDAGWKSHNVDLKNRRVKFTRSC